MDDNKYTGDLWAHDPDISPSNDSSSDSSSNNTLHLDMDTGVPGLIQEPEQPVPVESDQPQQVSKPTPQESFAEMRSKAEKLQRERDEAVLRSQQIEQYVLQQQRQLQQQQVQSQPEPEYEYHDDDYIEGKQFKNEINRLKGEINTFKQYQQQTSVVNQLRNKYHDFDKVMTYENISKIAQQKPELAATLAQATDLYSQAAATYSVLKDLGIYKENTYNPERERVEHNVNKPRVASSLKKTESALSQASELNNRYMSADRKEQIWKKMQENIR